MKALGLQSSQYISSYSPPSISEFFSDADNQLFFSYFTQCYTCS